MPLIYDAAVNATYDVGTTQFGDPYRNFVASGDVTGNNPTPGHTTSSSSSTSLNTTKTIEKVGSSFYAFDPVSGSFTPTGITDPNGTKTIVNSARGTFIVDSATGGSTLIPGTAPLTTASPDTQATEAGATARNNASIAASSGNSAADRAERAAEYAATYGQNDATAENAYNQYVQGFQRQQQQDKLAAADQYAKLISLTDPAALPAFYAAGGGNIMNAIQSGANGLSTNAVLPAAQTLRTIDQPAIQPAPFVHAQGFQQPAITGQQVYAPTPASGIGTGAPAVTDLGNGMTQAAQPIGGASYNGAPIAGAWGGSGAPAPVATPREYTGTQGFQRFAHGSFIAGDSTDPNNPAAGGAHPEEIDLAKGPDGQPEASVTPLTTPGTGPTNQPKGFSSLSNLFHAVGDVLDAVQGSDGVFNGAPPPMNGTPRFADGTADQNPVVTAGDQPYIDQVTQFRQNTDATAPIDGGYMNAGFAALAPSLQQRYYGALQDKYGAPTQDTMAEQQQYALKGIRRQPVYGLVAQAGY